MAFSLFKRKKKSGKDHYHKLLVKQVRPETKDAVTIIFDQPEDKIEYTSGQFLTLILDIDGNSVRRSYSMCTSPLCDDELAVTVKNTPPIIKDISSCLPVAVGSPR